MQGPHKEASSKNVSSCFSTNLSNIFDRKNCKWLFSTVGRSAFVIGDIPAIFLRNRTAKVSVKVSIMCVRYESGSVATCLINFKGK